MLLAGWLLAGVAMAGCLYDPAFATLHQMAGQSYRRAVTALTLFGGFASTVFWPLSQYLLDTVGWRGAFAIYAGCTCCVCLPLHCGACRAGRATGVAHAPEATDAPQRPHGGAPFAWLAAALSLAAFISSAIAAHLIDAAHGHRAFGARRRAGRLADRPDAGRRPHHGVRVQPPRARARGRHVRVRADGGALALFTQVRGIWIVALAFVIPYGWANGVMTIVRGTVPAELFGHRDYGALLGRLALPQFILKAVAPFALTLLFLVDPAARAVALRAAAARGSRSVAIDARCARRGTATRLTALRRVRVRGAADVGRASAAAPRHRRRFPARRRWRRGRRGSLARGRRHAACARFLRARSGIFPGASIDRVAGQERQRHRRSAPPSALRRGQCFAIGERAPISVAPSS